MQGIARIINGRKYCNGLGLDIGSGHNNINTN